MRRLPAARARSRQVVTSSSPMPRPRPGIDDQHAEAGLVTGLEHLAEVAVQHQRHAADDGAVASGHQQLGVLGPPGDVLELAHVLRGREALGQVDARGELADPCEVLGPGPVDDGGLGHGREPRRGAT